MQQSSGLSMWLIVGLIIIVWPIFFIALWSAIVFLMSVLGGWSRLARTYRTDEQPGGGKTISHVTGMVGIASYKKVLSITTNERGMFIEIRRVFRICHPTLFIPWSDIHNAHKVTLFYWDYVAFKVGDPAIASMRLPQQIFDGSPVFID
jgi:hypothetical protein